MYHKTLTSGDVTLHVLEINSYVRGFHAYMERWTPTLVQVLILKREPNNDKDRHAVAVLNNDVVVGHVPYNLAPRFSQYLRREVNKAFAEVTGEKVNRGAGYGLEIPCVYRLHGPKVILTR